MLDAFFIAATGMQAQQQHVDTIANNLANVNTPGFKKARVNFTDLVARANVGTARAAADADLLGVVTRPLMMGAGVSVASRSASFETGELKKTDAPLDVAIVGEGFLEVVMNDGSRAFSRGGTLKVDSDGMLALNPGQVLKPSISVPPGTEKIAIAPDGTVRAKLAGQAQPVEIGRLELVRFQNLTGLTPLGDNLFRATESSGEPTTARAGEDGTGTLSQGFIELSNVRLVDEMVSLMVAQRAYEASLKVAAASDEMLGLINNLRK